MTQRAVFTREMIVEAAFQLTRERGWNEVRARTIAQKLGSSTMPLYSTLRSMEEIEREVRARAEACMQGYQRRKYTGQALLDSAVGYIVFARDEKNLFRFLYVDRPLAARQPQESRETASVEQTGGVFALAEQSAAALKDPFVLKSWAFTHGLASLISSGVLALPDQTIVQLLTEVGAALYASGEGGKNE